MDPEKDEYINFDEIITELHANLFRCERDCQTCHNYILKLISHLNSVHIEPSTSAEGESGESDTNEVSPRRSSRNLQNGKFINYSEKKTDSVKMSELSEDHSSNTIDSDDIDIKYEFDLGFDSNVCDNPDPLGSDLADIAVGENYNSENTCTENDQTPRKKKRKKKEIYKQHLGENISTCETDSHNSGSIKLNEVNNRFTCSICHKVFSAAWNLERHMRLHTGEKPHKCDQCDKSYSRRDILRKHKMFHNGEKPYKCDYCDNCYARSENLMKHMRRHTIERPYKCDLCEKSFSKSFDMVRHRRLHTGEKPFKCDECDQCFSRKDVLNIHKITHAGQKPQCLRNVVII